ncbi:MAG: hypothetical protein CVV05_10495 [Gammaproteobacteria bacterium HGW-Gammaproteobacteria-1]|jgi:hypothetical protein|nr:MAG: hypothetical protein CVV05_10495 [Gammaproteobacteria bacterium HGW-Gammaproteobacteria-1]
MAEIGPIHPTPPGPAIRPRHVPAEERDKERQSPPEDKDEAPPEAGDEPAADMPPPDEEHGDDDDAPHIDVYV